MTPEQTLRKATAKRAQADRAWREAIQAAAKAGLSRRKIAPLAGVSHQRVTQILGE